MMQAQTTEKFRVLFVDDEQRVLNSMRVMFRREYDLFLASNGAEALQIIQSKDIDVIVADHRMPNMTGVEVLTRVRTVSPRTVRILLTGYADLDAVEGSINEGEVFRFLTKPCAPDQLRQTVAMAAKLSRETAEAEAPLSDEGALEIILESEPEAAAPPTGAPADEPVSHTKTDVIPRSAMPLPPEPPPPPPPSKPKLANGFGVIVFTSDDEVVEVVQQAVRGRLPVYKASNIVKVVKILTDHRPGVLITDISDDKATIQAMTARLKEHLPELVTIAVSQHRDVLDMVWLINHGQIFRFLRKPLSSGRCAISLQAALKHHRMLLKNPELVKRHGVDAAEDTGLVDGMLNKLKNVRRFWASA